MALTAEDKKRLSKEDQDRIQAYTTAWEQAKAKGDKTGMANAAAQAKALRENSGYSSNADGSFKSNTRDDIAATSAYKGGNYLKDLQNSVNDYQTINLGNGKTTRYSQTLADSKNATAWIPGVGTVRVTTKDGKTQESSLPVGTIITPDGSNQSWKINGANANGYTSEAYTGNMTRDELTKMQGDTPAMREVYANNPQLNSDKVSAYNSVYNNSNLLSGNSNNLNSNNSNLLSNLLTQQQNALKNSQSSAEAAIQAAIEKGMAQYNNQKGLINQQTDESLKNAYIQNMLGNRNLEQQLKGMGYSGGLSESAMLDKASAYENLLNSTRQQGSNQLNDVDTLISQLVSEGEIQKANSASEYQQALVDLLGQNYDRTMSQYNADRNYNYQVGRDNVLDNRYNQQWNYQVGQDQLNNDRYNTEWNYQLEQDKLSNDRYNTEWENTLKQQAYENALKSAKLYEKEPVTYNKSQYDIALNAYKNGDRSQTVVDIIEGYSGLPVDTVMKGQKIDNSLTNSIAKSYYQDLLSQAETAGKNPSENEVYTVAKELLKQGVPDEEVIKFARLFGYNLE